MSERVAVEGGSLFARVDASASDASWIVLSNSLAADHTMWDPQMPVLTRRYRVLRYDARGHGGSDAPPGPYSFDMLVADVVALFDHFRIQRATFMGLSLGGMTGLGLALGHPDRVARLVCCDARADAPAPFVSSWDDRIAAIDAGGMAAILQGTVERWLAPDFRVSHPQVVARVEAMILATDPEGYKACAAALKRLSYFTSLARMSVPTSYVVGSDDLGAPPTVMRAMAKVTPNATLAVIPGAHHLPNLDHPAEFEAAVASFLGLDEPASADP